MSKLIPIDSTDQIDQLLTSDSGLWIMKHSNACSLSERANQEIAKYLDLSTTPVHQVIIQTHREISNYLTEVTEIRHESPQVFFIEDSEIKWHGSHNGISVKNLQACDQKDYPEMGIRR